MFEFINLCFAIKKRSVFMKCTKSIYLCGEKFKKMNYTQRVYLENLNHKKRCPVAVYYRQKQ